MDVEEFDYELPAELIAQEPLPERDAGRLLVLPREEGEPQHRRMRDLPGLLRAGDVLVVNDARVIPARLRGRKEGTGGKVEVLLVEPLGGADWLALAQSSKPQTIFARERGAVAAPTAGLHFTPRLLEELRAAGVRVAKVTLHVGPGTFLPVRARRVEDHRMHRERYHVPAGTSDAVASATGRVIAVGTTALRTLEAAHDGKALREGPGSTDLFISPGYRFRAVQGLLTNFHLPRSTLLMLVSAFAGLPRIQAAYREAVARRYRFFSYGDAMLIV